MRQRDHNRIQCVCANVLTSCQLAASCAKFYSNGGKGANVAETHLRALNHRAMTRERILCLHFNAINVPQKRQSYLSFAFN